MSTYAMSRDSTSSRRESRGPRVHTHARSEVLRMLKEDHRVVKMAFREFDRLDAMDDAPGCSEIIRQTCTDLERHTRLEEDVFYPSVRPALPRTVLIDDAEVEHQAMNMLLAQVRQTTGPRQFASFRVLGEYIRHHVKQEEGELFRQLSHAKLDWPRLLEEMQERRRRLMIELEDPDAIDVVHEAAAGLRQGPHGQAWHGDRHS